MSAFCDKAFPSLRTAFKAVKSNVPLLVTVSPSFESGTSEETDVRVAETRGSIQSSFEAVRAELAKLGLKETTSSLGKTSPHHFYVRATKGQLETLAKCPQVRQLGIAA